jgi:sucrose phosphorylase
MLITYADCMGKDLKDLSYVLDHYLQDAVGGIHLLPFFPSSADRGFTPITYKEVDPAFGSWDDIQDLGENYYLMFDYMINHLSAESDIYKDFIKKKDNSVYKDFFIRYKDFWKHGGEPTQEEYEKLYKRKEVPYIEAEFADGTKEKLWTTFSDHQIDINQDSLAAKRFMKENLSFLAEHAAAVIRLDALGYASKREDTRCFFIEPEVWDILAECDKVLEPYDVTILPEVHEHYFLQKKLEERNYYTYDFQLPMLLLNAFYFGKTLYLKNWLKICPRKQFTTLDTHDGIGVVDARYLMPDEELLKTKRKVFEINPGISEVYVKSNMKIDFNTFDTYQINCTYFSALGEDEQKYFIARAVQFFTPGIPQVYYVGLFAGKNDFELYHRTAVNRDINRHYYSLEEIDQLSQASIVQRLNRLMKFRNSHPAFNGQFLLLLSDTQSLHMRWENDMDYADLSVDFISLECQITYSCKGKEKAFV